VRIQTERAEARQQDLGHVSRALGAGFVRYRGQQPHQGPQRVAAGDGAGQRLAAGLGGELIGGESADRGGS
jgi:hypothetical protein